MSQRDYRNVCRTGYRPLHDLNVSSLWWHSGLYWSPFIEREILEGLKEPFEEAEEKKPKFQVKVLCGFLAILTLLSVVTYMYANAITQTLQEVARISVQHTNNSTTK